MRKIMSVTISILLLLVLILPACGSSQATAAMPAWQADWNATLAAAKKEGKVVIYSGYGAKWRAALSEVMSRKYGITLDVVTASSAEIAERVMREQRTKTYQADVIVVGSSQFLLTFQPAGILQSLEKILILPEVTDPKVWLSGNLPWLDPEAKTYFQFYDYVNQPMIINSDLVKRDEMKSWGDLLSPKWKGKLAMDDPLTGSGTGSKLMTILAWGIMDWDFINNLVKQEPVLVRDNRLLVEWVARGKYSIGIAPKPDVVLPFLKSGAPISFMIPSEGTFLTQGFGFVSHPKGAPHPNTAKIFINFLLSKEGQTLSSNSTGLQSSRIDVPTDQLEPSTVRQPGVKYISSSDKGFMQKEVELKNKVKELFKPLVR